MTPHVEYQLEGGFDNIVRYGLPVAEYLEERRAEVDLVSGVKAKA